MSSADASNLFSRLRSRKSPTAASSNSAEIKNSLKDDPISRSVGHNASASSSAVSSSYSSKRASAPTMKISSSASRAAQELNEAAGTSSSTSNKKNSTEGSSSLLSEEGEKRRRHRDKSDSTSHRSKSRSRHRSKSRGRDKDKDAKRKEKKEEKSTMSASTATSTTGGTGGGESLRDYWKRRAEESKERVSGLEDKKEQQTQQQLLPPPSRSSREERSVKRSSSSRQVDSIASALTSHAPPSSPTRQIATDSNSLSPLHRAMEKASWKELHQHITDLSKSPNPTDIAAQLSIPHPRDGGTTLHVASWKVPPLLGAMMIQLMPENSREMAVLQSIRDGEGNTPLHLCCGNLDYIDDGIDHLAVLKAIVRVAPKSAWTMQNSEGDTPLHMLVTSPLCAASVPAADDDTVGDTSSKSTNAEKMALEAVNLALEAEAAVSATTPEGATPLHVALAHGAHDCVIEALLEAAPSAAEVEDERGLLPLHWAAAFGRVSHGVVKRLINAYPQAVTRVTIDGDIPLHLVVSNATIDGGDGGRGGSGSSDGKVDRNRLKIVELLMNDSALKSSPLRDTSDVTSPILTANREKLTPLHVSVSI